MARVRPRGNASTEGALAALFRAAGLRGWRLHLPLPGTPDFAFAGARVAVFADGCFWHGCPRHFRAPGTRRAYWLAKIRRNAARDRRVAARLRRMGWAVLRVRECEIARGRLPGRVLARLRPGRRRPTRSRD